MNQRLQSFLWYVVPFLLAAYAFFYFRNAAPLECMMYLEAAKKWLDGGRLYVDIIDINPPLVIYLSAIPVWLSRLVNVHSAEVFNFLVLGCLALSAKWLHKNLLLSGLFSATNVRFITSVWLVQSAFMNGWYTHGQREHLFVLFFFPYLVRRICVTAPTVAKQRESFWLGAVCGVFASFKPHFVLSVLVIEWAMAGSLRDRLRRPEILGFILVVIAYGLHFLFLPGDIQKAFFFELVPMVWQHYHSFNPQSLFTSEATVVLYFCTILWWLSGYLLRNTGEFYRALSLAFFSFVAVYFVQHKAFYYHNIPVVFLASFVVSAALTRLDWAPNFWRPVTKVSLYLGILILAAHANFKAWDSRAQDPINGVAKVYRIVGRYSSVSDPVLVVTCHMQYIFPVITSISRSWPSRYMFFFPISFFAHRPDIDESKPYPYKIFSDMKSEEKDFVLRIKEDLAANKPKLIVFTDQTLPQFQFVNDNFSFKDYFQHAGVLKDIENDYDLVHQESQISVYKLRKGG